MVLFGTAKGDLGAADGGCGIGMGVTSLVEFVFFAVILGRWEMEERARSRGTTARREWMAA